MLLWGCDGCWLAKWKKNTTATEKSANKTLTLNGMGSVIMLVQKGRGGKQNKKKRRKYETLFLLSSTQHGKKKRYEKCMVWVLLLSVYTRKE